MKIQKTAEGKNKLSITKSEWEKIGNEQGWMKKAQVGPMAQPQNPAPAVDPAQVSRQITDQVGKILGEIEDMNVQRAAVDGALAWLQQYKNDIANL